MPNSRSQSIRRSLRLSIDPSPFSYRKTTRISPDSASPTSSARASIATSQTTASPPTSDGSDWVIYSVLCIYDFDSSDPDHLPFSKNEILDVVKQESSGWWAALRQNGSQVGWIPSAFVQPLGVDMADRLRHVREELRLFEYEAEKLYNSAPITRLDLSESHFSPYAGHEDEWVPMNEGVKAPSMQLVTPTDLVPRRDFPSSGPRIEGNLDTYFLDSSFESSPVDGPRLRPPPSPSTPMPQPPPLKTAPLLVNKPTPPTPIRSSTFSASSSIPSTSNIANELGRSRSESATAILNPVRNVRRRPMRLDDQVSLSRLSTLIETDNVPELELLSSPDVSGSLASSTRSSQDRKNSADEDAMEAKLTQAHLPWYLRPTYTSNDIKLDADGNVKAGTLQALVERLTADSFKPAQDNVFRNAFLMTFRTFTTADLVFELLVERYQMDNAHQLTNEQFEEWKEMKLRPTQKRVLMVLTMWLEDHRLLEEEPHIGQKLTDFLSLIVTPAPLAITAKLIQESLERLTFARPSLSPGLSPQRRRKPKAHRNELLRLDPTDIAEQLSLLEYKLYSRIAPQECINWSKTQVGKTVANLVAFCATHDKLAAWVKMSILTNEVLGKRADTVDFWIKVAEKCRNLNNFSSMSALLTALSSTVITRLHLTWAHAGRKSHLDPLLKYNDPSGGFSAYRNLQQPVEGPCVPFITMFLTDIVHIGDQFSDTVPAPSPNAPPLIYFRKPQRWYETVSAVLRYQRKPYNIADNDPTRKFIEGHIRNANGKDQGWFWLRSQQVQQLELAHADIRKGLEAAGF